MIDIEEHLRKPIFFLDLLNILFSLNNLFIYRSVLYLSYYCYFYYITYKVTNVIQTELLFHYYYIEDKLIISKQ